jgi:hypothetical protein
MHTRKHGWMFPGVRAGPFGASPEDPWAVSRLRKSLVGIAFFSLGMPAEPKKPRRVVVQDVSPAEGGRSASSEQHAHSMLRRQC